MSAIGNLSHQFSGTLGSPNPTPGVPDTWGQMPKGPAVSTSPTRDDAGEFMGRLTSDKDKETAGAMLDAGVPVDEVSRRHGYKPTSHSPEPRNKEQTEIYNKASTAEGIWDD